MVSESTGFVRTRVLITVSALITALAFAIWPTQPQASTPQEAPAGVDPDSLQLPLSEQGPAPETEAVEIDRPLVPMFYPFDDSPLERPNFPPLDEIPPMPMPEGYDGNFEGGVELGSPVVHNAVTGETRVLHHPDVDPFLEEGFVTGGGYGGADGGEGEEIQTVFSNMVQITQTGDFPYRMNCKLVQRFENANGDDVYFVCSASMYDAETVLTAGHCVYHQTHGWAKEIWVIPGWDGNGNVLPIDSTLQTYGWGRGTFFASWTTWTQDGNLDGDVGLIRIERAVGMLTGWYGWSYGGDCSFHQGKTYINLSYPAEGCGMPGLHNGRDMYHWAGSVDSCPNNQLQVDTTGGCFNAGWGGMSGSGTYYIDGGRYIHGVASTADRATWIRYCRQWQSWIDYLNNTFIPDTRGASFDLQALDTNCEPAVINAGSSTTTLNHLATNPTNGTDNDSYTIRVYLSTNDNISSGDTLLSTQVLNWNFGAMSSVRVNMGNVTIPPNTPPGNYWIGVEYDAATDGNFGNNETDGWDAVPIQVVCPTPAPPSGVSATDGTECDFVRTTWNSVAGATEYRVLRNGGVLSAWQTGLLYDDFSAAPGVVYSYSVQSRNACGTIGGASASDAGFRCDRPDNDSCFDATVVSIGSFAFSNENATTDGPSEPECQFCCGDDNIGSDIWYRYNGLLDGRVTVSLCGSSYDTKIAVYEGDCPGVGGTLIGCNDDSLCGLQSEIEFFVSPGESYYIRVGGYNSAQGSGTFNLSFEASAVSSCLGVDGLSNLRINNLTGGASDRIVGAAYDSNILFNIYLPPAGGNGKFVVHMNPGMPTSGTISPLPAGLGDTCFPFLLTAGGMPAAIWTNINKPTQIGSSNFFGTPIPDPARAPTTFYSTGGATVFPIFSSWTIQGAIINPTASSPKGASVTNPVILDVLP